MTLWLILALMTVLAIAAVIWPLLRQGVTIRSGTDTAVYRDQLDEVERDRATGLIGKTEAEAARVEISRRLIAADEAAKHAPRPDSTPEWRRWAVAAFTLVLVPLGATALYLRIGEPGLASEPLAARMQAPTNNQGQSVEKLIVQVEQHLQSNPSDGRGWEVLAPVYMQVGRYTDSVNAWRNAITLLGESADREADLGEALTAAANGVVTAEAKMAFVRAVTLDDTTVTAQFYLGVAAQQDGDRDKAAKIWHGLIAGAKPGAEWIGTVRAALARLEGKQTPANGLPGPTPAEMLAAAEQSPAKREASISSMVDRLAERLKKDGSDENGWAQLVRSYKVMGEADKQKAAVADARQALAANPTKLKAFEVALKDIDSGAPVAAPPPTPTNGAALPGPTPAQMVAAADQPPMQTNSMITGMVARLAERLKKDGSDLKGWVRLVHSYKVLGETEKQKAAVADARKALASDPEKLKQFEAELKSIENGGNPTAVAVPPMSPSHPSKAPAGAKAQHEGETIGTMVEHLAEKLKKSGGDNPEGWLMLTRSYLTLNQKDKAMAAIKDARASLAANPDALKMFEAALKHYKIEAPQ